MWWILTSSWWSAASGAETALVLAGDDWRYLDAGVAPTPDWVELGYDDASWATGPAPLGYGLADVVTAVDYGGDPLDRAITTWFRHTFDVVDPSLFDALSVHLRCDDGAVVYLNGAEILRDNLPAGPIDASTTAIVSRFGEDQDRFGDAVAPLALLQPGENVLAVELHQQSPASSDLVLDLRLSGWDGPTAVTRGPYLQSPSPQGVVVRWRTDGPSAGRVTYGTDGGPLGRLADDPAIAFDHAVRVTGAPGEALRYAVGTPDGAVLAGGDADHVVRLPPASDDGPVRLWVLGDSGTANLDAEAVRDAYAAYAPDPLETDVWLMLGDNAYNSGTIDEYQEAVFDFYPDWLRQVPLWPVLGNHDAYSATSADQAGPYFDLFTLPADGEAGGVPSGTEAYWSFDHGPLHVIVLDSADSDRSATGAMAAWAEADLASVTDATWVIAAFHHPPYSKGSHDSDFESYMVEMRENLLPILEAGGVDLVLTGHSHSYERSMLLDGHYGPSDALLPSMIRQDHDGDPAGDGPYTKWPEGVAPHEGTVYVVAGSSGQVSGGSLDHPAMWVSLNALGSLVLDLDGLTLEGRFLDDAGIVLDTFAIDKGRTTLVGVDGRRLAASGEAITLTALAREPDGDEVPTYAWDWGDGTPDAVANPATHAWAAEGNYVVTVTATASDGEVASDTLVVAVDDFPPTIDTLDASPGTEGSAVTLTATASDPAGDPLTYTWLVAGVEHAGDVVQHVFFEDGTYPATLTVTDDAGRQAVGELVVTVDNAPPVFNGVTVPATASEAAPFVLSGSATDPAGFYDLITWTWTLPDGTTATGAAPTVTLLDDGPWAIPVHLDDGDGGTVDAVAEVTVDNLPPTVRDATWWGTPEEGAPLSFTASGVDPSPLDTITVRWSFDGGASWVDGGDVVHVFGDQGPHRVLVRAEDDDGGAGITAFDVALANVPPAITDLTLPPVVEEGVVAWIAVAAADPGYDDELTARWTFGDERREGLVTGVVLPDEGVYPSTVEVVDDEGAGASMAFSVTARNVAPRLGGEPASRVAPGASFVWAPEVHDVDPVTFTLDGPAGARVDAAGIVTWPAPADASGEVAFVLVADDGDGGRTERRWTVAVAGEPGPAVRLRRDDALAPCGCATPAGGAGWVVLAAVALGSRARARAGRRCRPVTGA